MQFLGKPFWDSHAFGLKQPASKENVKISPPQKEIFFKVPKRLNFEAEPISRRFETSQKEPKYIDRTNNPSPNTSSKIRLEAFIKENPIILDTSTFKKGSRVEKNYQAKNRNQNSSLNNHNSFNQSRSESKERDSSKNSYLEKERARKFFDQTKKITWDNLEKMNGKEMIGLSKVDFNPKKFLNSPNEEDNVYMKYYGKLGYISKNLDAKKRNSNSLNISYLGESSAPKRTIQEKKQESITGVSSIKLRGISGLTHDALKPQIQTSISKQPGLRTPTNRTYQNDLNHFNGGTSQIRANQIFKELNMKNGQVGFNYIDVGTRSEKKVNK